MTEAEANQLYIQFFNEESIYIADMDLAALNDRIKELNELAFEVRSKLDTVNSRKRKFVNALTPEERERLVTNPINLNSGRIIQPKPRAARKTKADKMVDALASLNLSQSDIESLTKMMTPEVKADKIQAINEEAKTNPYSLLVDKSKEHEAKKNDINPLDYLPKEVLAALDLKDSKVESKPNFLANLKFSKD